jgi:Fur family zinc uptake transcriptional regulator
VNDFSGRNEVPAEATFRAPHDLTVPGSFFVEDSGRLLTDNQLSIFQLIVDAKRPVGAYQLLAMLALRRSKVTPPTVYRALNVLTQRGLVHRLESLNAYVACSGPEHAHCSQFLICTQCGVTQELTETALPEALAQLAYNAGFAVHQHIIEIHGRCKVCARSFV